MSESNETVTALDRIRGGVRSTVLVYRRRRLRT